MEFAEKTVSSTTPYRGIIVNIRRDTAELHNGKQVQREVVEHPGGVVILPVDAEGYIYMVRQFRYPFMRELLEAPAGKLEIGEDPYACALRELKEETGFAAANVVDLGATYPSPGYSKEILYTYMAEELTQGEMSLDTDEYLRVEKWRHERLIELCMSGEICDGKTIIALFKAREYLQLRLRGGSE